MTDPTYDELLDIIDAQRKRIEALGRKNQWLMEQQPPSTGQAVSLWVPAQEGDVLDEPFQYLGCYARPATPADLFGSISEMGQVSITANPAIVDGKIDTSRSVMTITVSYEVDMPVSEARRVTPLW